MQSTKDNARKFQEDPDTIKILIDWFVFTSMTPMGIQNFFRGMEYSLDKQRYIQTSPITYYDESDECFVTLRGGKYRLGSPNREFDRKHPGTKQNLISTYMEDDE